MFNKQIALQYRNDGMTNVQIANRLGCHYLTVLKHIGSQPEFMTKNNRQLGQRIRRQKNAIEYSNRLTMQKIAMIDAKIVELQAQKRRLMEGGVA